MADGNIERPVFGSPRLVVDHSDAPSCQHQYLTLGERRRTVRCRVCKELVDPFEVLLTLSREWDWATHFRQQVDERCARVDALKKEEQQLKARIKNAVRTAPESRSVLFYEEWVRRLNDAQEHGALYEIDRWRLRYKWLTPEQEAALREATIRAQRRIEDNGRKRSRRVRVVDGGKVGEAPDREGGEGR